MKTLHKNLHIHYVHIFFLYIILVSFYIIFTINLQNKFSPYILVLGLANILLLISIHGFSKYFDRVEDEINQQSSPLTETPALLYGSITLLGASIILYASIPSPTITLAGLGFALIGFFYSYPPNFRIKNILFVKNLIPAFIWFYSLQLILFFFSPTLNFIDMLKINYPTLLLFIAFEILWDIPDIKGDKKTGVRTIPNVFGLFWTKIFITTLMIISILTTPFFVNQIISVIIIGGTWFIKKDSSKQSYHFLIYIIMILFLLYFILS